MDKDRLIAQGIDYEEGLNRFCGNAELYETFLKKFPKDETFRQLKDAMQQEDYKEAFNAAHTINGVAGNLSLSCFYHKVVPFVDLLRNGSNIPKAKETFPEIEHEYQILVDFLNQI